MKPWSAFQNGISSTTFLHNGPNSLTCSFKSQSLHSLIEILLQPHPKAQTHQMGKHSLTYRNAADFFFAKNKGSLRTFFCVKIMYGLRRLPALFLICVNVVRTSTTFYIVCGMNDSTNLVECLKSGAVFKLYFMQEVSSYYVQHINKLLVLLPMVLKDCISLHISIT